MRVPSHAPSATNLPRGDFHVVAELEVGYKRHSLSHRDVTVGLWKIAAGSILSNETKAAL